MDGSQIEELVRRSLDKLYNSWNLKYGDLKIDEDTKRIRVVIVTGGWSENEEAVSEFNNTVVEVENTSNIEGRLVRNRRFLTKEGRMVRNLRFLTSNIEGKVVGNLRFPTFERLFLIEWKRGGRFVYEIPKSLFR